MTYKSKYRELKIDTASIILDKQYVLCYFDILIDLFYHFFVISLIIWSDLNINIRIYQLYQNIYRKQVNKQLKQKKYSGNTPQQLDSKNLQMRAFMIITKTIWMLMEYISYNIQQIKKSKQMRALNKFLSQGYGQPSTCLIYQTRSQFNNVNIASSKISSQFYSKVSWKLKNIEWQMHYSIQLNQIVIQIQIFIRIFLNLFMQYYFRPIKHLNYGKRLRTISNFGSIIAFNIYSFRAIVQQQQPISQQIQRQYLIKRIKLQKETHKKIERLQKSLQQQIEQLEFKSQRNQNQLFNHNNLKMKIFLINISAKSQKQILMDSKRQPKLFQQKYLNHILYHRHYILKSLMYSKLKLFIFIVHKIGFKKSIDTISIHDKFNDSWLYQKNLNIMIRYSKHVNLIKNTLNKSYIAQRIFFYSEQVIILKVIKNYQRELIEG